MQRIDWQTKFPAIKADESIQMFCFCFFLFVTELMHKLICFAVTFANN